MTTVHHRPSGMDGRQLSCRVMDPAGAPAVVLSHSLLASTFVFRQLVAP
jgi:hypothetical protein